MAADNLWLIISFIAYTAGIVFIGLYSSRLRKRTTDDFVLANRELGPWVAALSASASAESGWVMLGLVGEAYLFGLAAFWIVPGIAAGYIVNWFILAERLRVSTAGTGAATLPQYIMHRFGKNSMALRSISVFIIGIAMLTYVAAQMNAAGKAFEATFSLDYVWGVLVGAGIILAYTIVGGFRAVCWTDVIQATFMALALLGMPLIMLADLGGFGSFLAQARETAPDLLSFSYNKAGFAAFGFVVGLLGIGLGYPGQPHVLSRYMAAQDNRATRLGGRIAMVWMVLSYIGAVFFGLFSKVYFGTLKDPEQALPLAINDLVPPVVGGFMIAAIVSAICSTADSQLIVVSTTLSRDIWPLLRKRSKQASEFLATQWADRIVLIVLAMISIALAAGESRVIFEFVLYAWSALGASFGPVVILGLLWKRANKAGAIAGMLTGLIVTVVWRNVPVLKGALYELVPAFILAFLAVVIVSLMTRQDEAPRRG